MRTYKCINISVHPLHSEEEVAAAISKLRSLSCWGDISRYMLAANYADSSWAHWACRVVERCEELSTLNLAVERTLNILKNKLSGPDRRNAPRAWYREVFTMVNNPLFGMPGQKKQMKQVHGYIVGNGSCIKTFRPGNPQLPPGVPF